MAPTTTIDIEKKTEKVSPQKYGFGLKLSVLLFNFFNVLFCKFACFEHLRLKHHFHEIRGVFKRFKSFTAYGTPH